MARPRVVLQGVRDVILAVFSIVKMSASHGKWAYEPAAYVVFGTAAIILILAVMDIARLLLKSGSEAYHYNFAFVTSMLMALLLPPVGFFLFALNAVIIFELKKEKAPTKTRLVSRRKSSQGSR